MSVAIDKRREKNKKKYMVYDGNHWNLLPSENYADAVSFCKQHKIKIVKALPYGEWLKQ